MIDMKILEQRENHSNSQVVEAIGRYSASVEDLETLCYFFDFQEISESRKKSCWPNFTREEAVFQTQEVSFGWRKCHCWDM